MLLKYLTPFTQCLFNHWQVLSEAWPATRDHHAHPLPGPQTTDQQPRPAVSPPSQHSSGPLKAAAIWRFNGCWQQIVSGRELTYIEEVLVQSYISFFLVLHVLPLHFFWCSLFVFLFVCLGFNFYCAFVLSAFYEKHSDGLGWVGGAMPSNLTSVWKLCFVGFTASTFYAIFYILYRVYTCNVLLYFYYVWYQVSAHRKMHCCHLSLLCSQNTNVSSIREPYSA